MAVNATDRRLTMATVARVVLPPVLVFVLFLAGWEGGVRYWEPPAFLLPGPWAVGETLVVSAGRLWRASLQTGFCAVMGFALSLVVGCLVAFVMSQSRVIERSLFPYAIFLQTVPIIAVAPIIVLWFNYGPRAIIIVSFIISLFPIITNSVTGLTTPQREWMELMRVYRASWWTILWKLRLPAAVPHIATGARISAGLSVVGAIVGEYFAGSSSEREGLATIITQAVSSVDMPLLMATTIVSTILGLAIFITVSLSSGIIMRIGHFQEERK